MHSVFLPWLAPGLNILPFMRLSTMLPYFLGLSMDVWALLTHNYKLATQPVGHWLFQCCNGRVIGWGKYKLALQLLFIANQPIDLCNLVGNIYAVLLAQCMYRALLEMRIDFAGQYGILAFLTYNNSPLSQMNKLIHNTNNTIE